MNKEKPCPDCGCPIGDLHDINCDIARCPVCGQQRLSCEHSESGIWQGEWPGKAECRKHNLWSKMIKGSGWVPCSKDDPEAHEDLNRLGAPDFYWDQNKQRWTMYEVPQEVNIMIEEFVKAKKLIQSNQATLIYNMSLAFFWGALQQHLNNPKVCEKIVQEAHETIKELKAWFNAYYSSIHKISTPPFTD